MNFFKISLLTISACAILSGCVKLPDVPKINASKLTKNQRKTLTSIKKLNNYPLYSMKYYGDYSDLESVNKKLIFDLAKNKSQCTSIASHGKKSLFGRNHDYTQDPVLVLFTNPKNKYSSISMVDLAYIGIDKKKEIKSLKDKSSFLYAPFAPCDGMNEKGLAIGLMARDDQISFWNLLTNKSIIGNKKEQNLTSSLMIIRKVLDNAATVEEAVKIFKKHSIYFFATVRLHYLVSDKYGKSAVIEFENNTIKIINNRSKWQVSTNHGIYSGKEKLQKESKKYWKNNAFRKTNEPDSYWRYITADHMAKNKYNSMSTNDMMNILQKVSMEFSSIYGFRITNWSVVYDQENLKAHISIGRKYNKTYNYSLK